MSAWEWLVAAAFVAFVIVAGAIFRHGMLEDAALDADLAEAGVAVRAYARHRCSSIPGAAVDMENVLLELGRSAAIRNPGDWSVLLAPRPGADGTGIGGVSVTVRYETPQDTRASRHLLLKSGSRRQGAFIEIPVELPGINPQRASFQHLFSDAAC